MVLVDIRETKSAKAADIFLQVRPGKDFELITILRAMIKGHDVADEQIAETGLTRETVDDLIHRMKSAKFGCFFFSSGFGSRTLTGGRSQILPFPLALPFPKESPEARGRLAGICPQLPPTNLEWRHGTHSSRLGARWRLRPPDAIPRARARAEAPRARTGLRHSRPDVRRDHIPRRAVTRSSRRRSGWGRVTGLPPPIGFAETLMRFGFFHPEALTGVCRAWRTLVDAVRPQLMVFDYAPTGMLATRGLRVPRVLIGESFSIPPRTEPMPIYRWWRPEPPARILEAERRVLANANAVLARLSEPPMQTARGPPRGRGGHHHHVAGVRSVPKSHRWTVLGFRRRISTRARRRAWPAGRRQADLRLPQASSSGFRRAAHRAARDRRIRRGACTGRFAARGADSHGAERHVQPRPRSDGRRLPGVRSRHLPLGREYGRTHW